MPFVMVAIRNLGRRPLRTILAAGGVALAVASWIALLGLVRGHVLAWEQNLTAAGTDLFASRKGAIELMSTSIPETVGGQLARLPGVRDAAGELIDMVGLDSGQTVLVSGRPTDSYLWTSLHLVSGRLPASSAPSDVAVGAGIAGELNLRPGDRIALAGHALVVSGIVHPVGALTSHMLFLPLPVMQRLLDRTGVVTIVNVRLTGDLDAAGAARFIEAARVAFPELTFIEARAIGEQNPLLRALDALAWSVSTVALVMGLAGVLNALLMSVTERVREMGILSAVGWSPARIIGLIASEGLLLGTAGSLAGSALGIAALHAIGASRRVGGLIEVHVAPLLVLEAIVAAIALAGLGSLYPAWHATRLAPVDALRHE